jgi:hypothetical protein
MGSHRLSRQRPVGQRNLTAPCQLNCSRRLRSAQMEEDMFRMIRNLIVMRLVQKFLTRRARRY